MATTVSIAEEDNWMFVDARTEKTASPLLRLWLIAVVFWAATARGAEYYVDPDSHGGPGSDSGLGTQTQPWHTLGRAVDAQQQAHAAAGDTVWLRGGVYREQVTLRTGGANAQPLVIRAFCGEKPVFDGERQRAWAIRLPGEGHADRVVIEGVTLREFKPGGTGILVAGRTDVTLRDLEVSHAGTGVLLTGCTGCQLLRSHVHNCQAADVALDSACTDILIADNHLHHALGTACLSVYAPADGVRGQGAVASVAPHGAGLATFTMKKLQLDKVRDGTLTGQNDAHTVRNPSLLLLFPDRDPNPNGQPLAGGSVHLADGRAWFALHNNPDWNGKPYSPDGRTGLFETGGMDAQTLSRANPHMSRTHSTPRLPTATSASCGTKSITGPSKASGCRGPTACSSKATVRITMALRESRSRACPAGSGSTATSATPIALRTTKRRAFWLDETIDAVVQNNAIYENLKGMGASQCQWVLVRRNAIYRNQAQHAAKNAEECRRNTGAFYFSGGYHSHLGAPPGGRHNAFVHNTVFANGTPTSYWGGVMHGLEGSPRIAANRILNNLVQDNFGAYAVFVGCAPAVLNGNVYHAAGFAPGVLERCRSEDDVQSLHFSRAGQLSPSDRTGHSLADRRGGLRQCPAGRFSPRPRQPWGGRRPAADSNNNCRKRTGSAGGRCQLLFGRPLQPQWKVPDRRRRNRGRRLAGTDHFPGSPDRRLDVGPRPEMESGRRGELRILAEPGPSPGLSSHDRRRPAGTVRILVSRGAVATQTAAKGTVPFLLTQKLGQSPFCRT